MVEKENSAVRKIGVKLVFYRKLPTGFELKAIDEDGHQNTVSMVQAEKVLAKFGRIGD